MSKNCSISVIPDELMASNSYNDFPLSQYSYQQTPALIPNPLLNRMRKVTFISYSILLGSAPVYFVTYAVLWSQIQPPLNLRKTGNGWTFILFLVTCLIITVLGLIITILHRNKFPLRWKHVVGSGIMLVACYTGLLMVVIGTLEQSADRSKCNQKGVQCSKYYAPKTPTTFGIYVAGVCGKNLTESDLENAPLIIPTIPKDNKRCEATKVLKIAIFCMYIWTIELMLVTIVEMRFGVGYWENRNLPEFIQVE